jgi:6-phospho-beta-glucosidase
MGIHIGIIGGASSYTPELFADLFEWRGRLAVDRVTLVDVNTEKLAFIADICTRLCDSLGFGVKIGTSQACEAAITGADFIILQLRVGGLDAQIRDETVPLDLGIAGSETTGPGGFACALRTLPLVMDIVRDVERLAPDAWLLNLTNPAGIVTEAILRHSRVRV